MIKTPKLNAEYVSRVIKAMRNIDPQMVKDLRTGLRSNLKPLANRVVAAVPTTPPLSGFARGTGTGWSKVTGTVSFTPGRSRKTGNSLVSLRVGQRTARGVYIAELAGSRSSGLTAAGANLITVLNSRKPMKGRGGRYIYNEFRKQRPLAISIAESILNRTFKDLEKKL